MKKRRLGVSVLVTGALVLAATGISFAAAQAPAAKPPAGEPVVPGASYASGLGAPYLSTVGAPRKMAGAGIGAIGGTLGRVAAAAGTKAGKAAGPKLTPQSLRVGYLDIIGGIESADRAHNSLRVAFTRLGSKWLYCDGQGTPTKWVTCGNSLLAQDIDVLALTGIDPSTIPSVVQAAKAKGVPIIDFGGTVGPGYAAQFAPNETKNGRILAAYLKAKLASQSGVSNIVSIDYPAPWAQQRTAELKKMVARNSSKLKISVSATTDPTNLIAGTQKLVSDALTADPNVKAIWVSFDTAGQAAGQVVASRYPGKKFPDRPLVVTFHADPSTQGLMKKGGIDVVVDNNYDATAWQLADATIQFFARKKPFPPYTTSYKHPGIGDPLAYEIVTKGNLPKQPRRYVAPPVDVVTYFTSKWKAEGLIK
jgi:ABC-type sugar transport system substrate-binding protein